MEHTIVNGASAIGRGVTKYLTKGSSGVKILDYRVFRRGLYNVQEEMGNVKIEKQQTTNSTALEYALEGADTVVYFTHDYPSMSFNKNNMLEATSKAAKSVGVNKLICVCPIEYDFYYAEDGKDALQDKREIEQRVLGNNSNLVLLRPNLVFGDYSYLIRYMTQSIIAGKLNKSLAEHGSDAVKYFPIHMEDLSEAIRHAIDNFAEVKGQDYSVKGSEEATLGDIRGMIEKYVDTNVSTYNDSFSFGNFMGELLYGVSHDKNMRLMAEYFKNHNKNFSIDKNYMKENGVAHKHKISEFFHNQDLSAENYVYPLFSGYKHSELD